MKKTKLIFAFLFLLSTLLGLISCSPETPDNSFITISQKVISFEEAGERVPITAQIFSQDTDATPEWTTSNPDVAIYENGEVVAVGYGTCVIRASYKNISAACTVNFENPYSSLKLSESLVEFSSIGALSSITAKTGTVDLTSLVIWSSSNESIATCNQNGVITTHGYGACIIMARLGAQTAFASIIVSDPDEKSLTLSENELTLNTGECHTFSANAENHEAGTVKWISSNPEILECTSYGVVTALKRGVCAVVAVTELGASSVCVVTVEAPPAPPSINPDQLIFTMPDFPSTHHTVDGETGEIIASAVATHYTITPTFDDKTGRLYLQIELHFVKIYDKNGDQGMTTLNLATNLYRENDTHCERRLYKKDAAKVGDAFTVKCALFSVQTTPGTVRDFYFTLEDVCEV